MNSLPRVSCPPAASDIRNTTASGMARSPSDASDAGRVVQLGAIRSLLRDLAPEKYRRWSIEIQESVSGDDLLVVHDNKFGADMRFACRPLVAGEMARRARSGAEDVIRYVGSVLDFCLWLADPPKYWGRISRKHERLRLAEMRP